MTASEESGPVMDLENRKHIHQSQGQIQFLVMLLQFFQMNYLEPPLTISPTEILPSESDNCVMLHQHAECLHGKLPSLPHTRMDGHQALFLEKQP